MSHSRSLPIYEGPADWRGPDTKDSKDWHIHLTDSQILEIKSAAQRSIDDNFPILDIKPENFPLPGLSHVLKDAYQELLNGRGFVVFHGMPVQDLSREEIIRAYVGIGSWLGNGGCIVDGQSCKQPKFGQLGGQRVVNGQLCEGVVQCQNLVRRRIEGDRSLGR